MPLAPGDRLGPYEILAPLGAGGMGEVYRARDSRIGREVAVKVLPASYAEDPDRLKRFEQEARTAGGLNHPNLLVLFDVGRHQGLPYLVSELLEGVTLREALGRTAPSVRKAIDYGSQVARGLAAAHDRAVVHRDLKPENLFVTSEGRVKILDFGLARVTRRGPTDPSVETLSSPTEPGVLLGTLGYMSPEQARGLSADHRADIFSFGAVLYEMVTGQRAFRGETSADTLAAILHRDPPEMAASGRDVPPALERILRRCLEKNPAERFQSAHDLAFALEGLSATSRSQPAADVSGARSRRWLRIAGGLTALALPVAAFLLGRRGADRTMPSFQRLTFRRGAVQSARFAPDGRTVLYSAAWDGDAIRAFSTRIERPESARLDVPDAQVEAVSSSGEMLITLGRRLSYFDEGTLARVPLTGGAPRAIAENVIGADWGPDGEVALVRKVGDSYRLEYPAGHLLYENKEGLWPPRVSPDGKRLALYTDGQAGSTVTVVDTNGAPRVLTSGWKWHGRFVAWSPSGDEVWFAASEGGWVHPLRAVTLSGRERIVLNLPGWTNLHDIPKDGRVLLSSGHLRSIAKCLPPGETRERDVSWFESTGVQYVSPDGRTVLLSEVGAGGGPGSEGAAYVRKTDGSPPVRLGEAFPVALSPDGRLVLASSERTGEFSLLPTGPGAPRRLDFKGVASHGVAWHPNGKSLFLGSAAGGERKQRCFAFDLDTGTLEPVTAEGVGCGRGPSPDGKALLAIDEDGRYLRHSLTDGQTQTIPGLGKDMPLQWGADSRSLFVRRDPLPRARIDRLDLITGRRGLWREIYVADPAGFVADQSWIEVAQNGSYCYTYMQMQSDLYQVEGIR